MDSICSRCSLYDHQQASLQAFKKAQPWSIYALLTKKRGGILIKIDRGLGLLAKRRSRARCSNLSFQCCLDSLGLARLRTQTNHFLCSAERGNGECKGIGRHGFQAWEMAFIHLLDFAGIIQLNQFYEMRISEIGYGRIVKGNMTVFSDTQTAQIDRGFLKELGVTLALIQRQRRITDQIVEVLRFHQAFHSLFHVEPETGLVRFRNTQILVHVEQSHSGPIHSTQINKRFQKLNLLVPGRKDGSH